MSDLCHSRLQRLRLRLGVWLLKPHWLPTLEHYSRMQLAENNIRGPKERERCTYIAIGIRRAIGVGKDWSRY